MRIQDKRNLIRSWPVYLLFLTLLVVMIIFYQHNQARMRDESLPRSIQKGFYGVNGDRRFNTLDQVINDRKSWQPRFPDWQQKPIDDFAFTGLDGQPRRLRDFAGRPTVVLIWASWYPACKMQLIHLREALALTDAPASVIALTAEKPEALVDFPTADYPHIIFGSVSRLPEPFSLPDTIPAVFFIAPDGTLTLAAEGLVTAAHAAAILDLSR